MKKSTRRKIDEAIELLQKYEKVALQLNSKGYFLAFSGGKDSQLLYLIAELSGVKFKAYFSNTTNELPENIKFIRKHYPMVEFLNPPENFYKLVAKKGLPTRIRRYCCSILKEGAGAGYAVLTGERREESAKRKMYPDVSVQSRNPKRQKVFSADELAKHECIKGKDRLRIRPILNFSESEVWEVLKYFSQPLNPCYELQHRVGCILCPFAKKGQIEKHLSKYPRVKKTLLKNLQVFLNRTNNSDFDDAEDCFKWWLSLKNVREYKCSKNQTELTF